MKKKEMIDKIIELSIKAEKANNIKTAMDGYGKVAQMEGHLKEPDDDPNIVKIDKRRATKEQIILMGLDEETKKGNKDEPE